jgi:D-alanyl-D-alanine carboxypeptidase
VVKFGVVAAIAGLIVSGCVATVAQTEPEVIDAPPPPPVAQEVVVEEPAGFDLTQLSIDDAWSIWVVVNKLRPLNPIDFAPVDLVAPEVPAAFGPLVRAEVARAVEEMYGEATAAGVPFRIQSTYRSYTTQQRVKANSVSRLGQAVSDQRSARPGHSEHQTGLAVDLTTWSNTCTLDTCFADTPEGAWLADNAWRFGFILRYPEGASDITGYVFEPWHFRYVGVELAEHWHLQGNPTLEELFGLDPAPHYADAGDPPPVSPAPAPEPGNPGESSSPGRDEAGEPDFPDDPQ